MVVGSRKKKMLIAKYKKKYLYVDFDDNQYASRGDQNFFQSSTNYCFPYFSEITNPT